MERRKLRKGRNEPEARASWSGLKVGDFGLLAEPMSGCTTKCTQLKETDDFMQSTCP